MRRMSGTMRKKQEKKEAGSLGKTELGGPLHLRVARIGRCSFMNDWGKMTSAVKDTISGLNSQDNRSEKRRGGSTPTGEGIITRATKHMKAR